MGKKQTVQRAFGAFALLTCNYFFCYLYSWIRGSRRVRQFQGDAGEGRELEGEREREKENWGECFCWEQSIDSTVLAQKFQFTGYLVWTFQYLCKRMSCPSCFGIFTPGFSQNLRVWRPQKVIKELKSIEAVTANFRCKCAPAFLKIKGIRWFWKTTGGQVCLYELRLSLKFSYWPFLLENVWKSSWMLKSNLFSSFLFLKFYFVYLFIFLKYKFISSLTKVSCAIALRIFRRTLLRLDE